MCPLISLCAALAATACVRSSCPCERQTDSPAAEVQAEPDPEPEPEAEPAASSDAAPSADSSGEAQAEAGKCSSEAQRRFDFWQGRWVVHSKQGKLAGHNFIERAHDGCALIEHWRSARGGSGTSTNYWDPAKQAWVQNWIDASGSVIQLEGDLREGSMVLEGRYVKPDGSELKMRGTWTPLDDGRVRQFFETSPDGDEWTPWFEGFYTREQLDS